jgi:hypothetical protein
MFATEKATSQTHSDAQPESHEGPSETHWHSGAPGPLSTGSTSHDNLNVLTVDWEGPDDPENPQKYASTSFSQPSLRLIASMFVVGASNRSGEQPLSSPLSHSLAPSPPR